MTPMTRKDAEANRDYWNVPGTITVASADIVRRAANDIDAAKIKIQTGVELTHYDLWHNQAAALRLLADQMEKDDRDAKLAEAGVKIVELEKEIDEQHNQYELMLKTVEKERDEERRARIAAQDEAGALEGEKDRLEKRIYVQARRANLAERVVLNLSRKSRDLRARVSELEAQLNTEDATDDEIEVVFRYRKGGTDGISVEDASDLAVKLGMQFEAEIEGLDEPENEGSDKVA